MLLFYVLTKKSINMTTDEIENEVRRALDYKTTLLVSKYHTTAGAVKDYVLELLPPNGYLNMVQESLDVLSNVPTEFTNKYKPENIEVSNWIIAMGELITSFRNSLIVKSSKPAGPQSILEDNGIYYYAHEFLGGERVKTIIIKHMRVLSSVTHAAPPEKISHDPVVRAKVFIRNLLPINNYLGQLNLEPGKVELVKSTIIPLR